MSSASVSISGKSHASFRTRCVQFKLSMANALDALLTTKLDELEADMTAAERFCASYHARQETALESRQRRDRERMVRRKPLVISERINRLVIKTANKRQVTRWRVMDAAIVNALNAIGARK